MTIDQPVVTPASSNWGAYFIASYKRICSEINTELAEDCTDCVKAFTNTHNGKVLGVWFRSTEASGGENKCYVSISP
jgi:hypothetical protein